MGSKNRQTTPATTSTNPVCQLLGSATAETVVQGPIKKQQPDGMSHRGGGVKIICLPQPLHGQSGQSPLFSSWFPQTVASDGRMFVVDCVLFPAGLPSPSLLTGHDR